MAINSCSINAHTINALACRRRSFVPQVVAEKSHVQQVRYQHWLGSRTDEDEEQNIGQLENSHINVSVTLNGKTYSQTLENSIHDVIPMIAVSDIRIEQIDNQQVDVLNLQIRSTREK